MCVGGIVAGTGSTFALGVLIDVNTGLLRTDLAAPPKVLAGSFCSSRSTITVNATPLAAQTFTTTPPTGFSRSVNYTATAAGWTTTTASFSTGADDQSGGGAVAAHGIFGGHHGLDRRVLDGGRCDAAPRRGHQLSGQCHRHSRSGLLT